MKFRDRKHAGQTLAARLGHYADRPDVIVLALPNGGAVVANEIAGTIGLPLDVFLVHKLAMPDQPDLIVGAVATGGTRVLNYHVVQTYDLSTSLIDQIAEREHRNLQRREIELRGARLPLNIQGKTVIVVDDGLSTGATMRAAVSALEKHRPAARVVAVPVSSYSAWDDVGAVVDEIICLATPSEFESIEQFYEDYSAVSDQTVAELLART